MRRTLLTASFLILHAMGVVAAPAPLAAVGVVRIGDDGAGCTGTLIAPDLVLTAGHCLHEGVERLSFRPGRTPGAPEPVVIPALRKAVHPIFALGLGDPEWRARYDIGLLRLETPVTADVAEPLAVGDRPDDEEALFLASFRGARGDAARQRRCPALQVETEQVFLGCDVHQGESGSPVLRQSGDTTEILAVVTTSRRILRQPVAAGPLVEVALPGVRDALHALEENRQGGTGGDLKSPETLPKSSASDAERVR